MTDLTNAECITRDLPDDKTRARFAELVDDYQFREHEIESLLDVDVALHPWILIEESIYSGYEKCATGHATPEDAARYWGQQEHPEDWNPQALVNVATGERCEFSTEVVYEMTVHPKNSESQELRHDR